MDLQEKMSLSLCIHKHPMLQKSWRERTKYLEKLEYFIMKYAPEDAFSIAVLKQYKCLFERRDSLELTKRKSISNKWVALFSTHCVFVIDGLFLCAFDDEEKGALVLDEMKTFITNGYHKKLDMLYEALYHNGLLSQDVRMFSELVYCWRKNWDFLQQPQMSILITANMSAGKSTFINALTGKNVSLSQNMACTNKIHFIISKPYEDELVYEYDYELNLDAGKEELLNDNDLNKSEQIIVSTYYRGRLGGRRMLFCDTPGVNYSGDIRHKDMSRQLLALDDYKVILYVMDGTQLRTEDEAEHLKYVHQHVRERTILFILNKIDAFNPEEEDIYEIVKNQKNYLEKIGFMNPCICPISSKAGYLAKKSCMEKMTRMERRELDALIFKFEQMKLPEYYKRNFPGIYISDVKDEAIQLQKNSGLAYVEEILAVLTKGEK